MHFTGGVLAPLTMPNTPIQNCKQTAHSSFTFLLFNNTETLLQIIVMAVGLILSLLLQYEIREKLVT